VVTDFEIDPQTGEVAPLAGDVFLVHYDRNLSPLGVWRINETEQVPMYAIPNGSAQEAAEVAFECRKGSYTSWASVIDRLLTSSDIAHQWELLDSSDGRSLLQVARDLGIR
jgi:hypothetical protein